MKEYYQIKENRDQLCQELITKIDEIRERKGMNNRNRNGRWLLDGAPDSEIVALEDVYLPKIRQLNIKLKELEKQKQIEEI